MTFVEVLDCRIVVEVVVELEEVEVGVVDC